MNETRRTVVSGPLAPYTAGFTDRLRERGYGQASVASHLRLLADVSRWLGVQGLSAPDLTPGRVDAFVLASRAGGTSGPWARRSFRRLLEYLVSLGIEVRPSRSSPWSSSSPPTAVTSKTSVGWGLLPSAATCARRGTSSCAAAGVIPPASTTCPPLTSRASSWPKRPRAQPTDGQRDGGAAAIAPALLLPEGPDLGSLGPGDTVDGQLAGWVAASLPRPLGRGTPARQLRALDALWRS